jgi:GNAT superfamily N-acetyltransferase
MIRRCGEGDFDAIFEIINDAAQAYRGVIPEDRWHEPYMSREHLREEIGAGVVFWGWEEKGLLAAVMGFQNVLDVSLIRHAYVRSKKQGQGLGRRLMAFLREQADRPMLVGTWASARWAVRFYEKQGFRLVTEDEKNCLLKKYWNIPERQVETSVVLADERWLTEHGKKASPLNETT